MLLAELQAIFPKEQFDVDSHEDGFKFLALHFGWYNKFSESVSLSIPSKLSKTDVKQGEGAPEDVHPDQLMREGSWKVNWLQREPRESADIRDHPELFNRVKGALEDVLRFVHDNV